MVQQFTPPEISKNNLNNIFDTLTGKAGKAQSKVSLIEKPENFIAPELVRVQNHELVYETENIIVNDIVKNVAIMYNYIFPCPYKIRYDPNSRKFYLQKVSYFWKVVCVLWVALIIWRLALRLTPSSETSAGVMAIMVKMSYVMFITYNLAFFMLVWTRGNRIVSIFNQIVDLSSDLWHKIDLIPNTKLIFYITHASWIFSFGFAFITHVLHKIIWYGGTPTKSDNQNGTGTDSYDLNKIGSGYSVFYQGLVIFANFLNTGNWMMTFLHVGTWAFAFRQLFIIFFWRIKEANQKGFEVNMVKEIRAFNNIGMVLNNFNKIYGGLILIGSLTAVFYVVSSIEQIITNVKNIAQYSQIYLVVSYLPIVVATLMVSDLHRVATKFSDIVKQLYNKWKWPTSEKASEALFGISIVYHDLAMANVGFKGLSFFTVTYPFLAAMLSLVITYSLVVIQWFPQLYQKQGKP